MPCLSRILKIHPGGWTVLFIGILDCQWDLGIRELWQVGLTEAKFYFRVALSRGPLEKLYFCIFLHHVTNIKYSIYHQCFGNSRVKKYLIKATFSGLLMQVIHSLYQEKNHNTVGATQKRVTVIIISYLSLRSLKCQYFCRCHIDEVVCLVGFVM